MSVTVKDNTAAVLKGIDAAVDRALFSIGEQAERYAKTELSKPKSRKNGAARPNVVTGLLRNSITFAVSGKKPRLQSYVADNGGKTGAYSGAAPDEGDRAVYVGTNVEYAVYVELGTIKSKAYPFLKPAATEHAAVYKRILKDELKNSKGV